MSKRASHAKHRDSDSPPTFTVAIVGRPNVGKSTLFNRLVGRRAALVHDRPGVTRDRRTGRGEIAGLVFTVIDTAGYEESAADTLEGRMREQIDRAITEADIALFLIDARAGITPMDEQFASLLRKSETPVALVANKCEGRGGRDGMYESFRLGLGEPIAVSAEHGEGLDGLYEALAPFGPKAGDEDADDAAFEDELIDQDEEQPYDPARPLQLAIIGRPNTGKSTLINRLIGDDRLLTGPEPGVTRDAISVDWSYKGRAIRFVDTAGVRRRTKVKDAVEKLSVGETFEAVKMAEVVVLVLDAEAVLDKQELTLARHVVEEGRALVIALNKWDAVKEKKAALQTLSDKLQTSLTQVRGIPTVTISGKTGQRVEALMDEVLRIHEVWNKRIPTAALNRWLPVATRMHPPPLSMHKHRVKLRYMTQAKARPPTFVIFSTRPTDLPDAYSRYLVNGLRDTFDLDGVPIRLHLRKPKNPYGDKD
jgi:GTPase